MILIFFINKRKEMPVFRLETDMRRVLQVR